MLGVVAWKFKGGEGNSRGDGKANVGKQIFAGTVGHRVDSGLWALPVSPHPHPHPSPQFFAEIPPC